MLPSRFWLATKAAGHREGVQPLKGMRLAGTAQAHRASLCRKTDCPAQAVFAGEPEGELGFLLSQRLPDVRRGCTLKRSQRHGCRRERAMISLPQCRTEGVQSRTR